LSADKRPEWLVRLAQDLPERPFDVVGQCNVASAYGGKLARALTSLPNVRWHGYVPHARMTALYHEAAVVLCTSESEGFPNVFLEAWSCGRPVLSSVDPDDIVTTFRLGQVASDYTEMRQCLALLDAHRGVWEAAGQRGRHYVRQHHDAGQAADAMAAVVHTCREATRRRRARVSRVFAKDLP
jgi:glycosyltransferase involved in cell wall biosynthesis